MEKTKKCPYCGEEILAAAKKCRYCGEWLKDEEEKQRITVERKMEHATNETEPFTNRDDVKDGFIQYYWGEVCRKHLFDFKGKLGRKDYWCAVIALFFMQFTLLILSYVSAMMGTGIKIIISIVSIIFYLLLFVTSMALAVRRLHDTGKSGWWLAINLIPFIGQIVLLVMLCQPGTTPSHRIKFNAGDWITFALLLFGIVIWTLVLS